MTFRDRNTKIAIIVGLIIVILSLHYSTITNRVVHHAIYRMLFYMPLVLACFWFGLKGAIGVLIAVFFFYAPYLAYVWRDFSSDLDKLLESGLYMVIALVLGYLSEKEKKQQAARLEAERLASIGRAVSEIAHDMKSPLMAIGGFVNQVSKKLPSGEPDKKKLDVVIRETARLESMVKEMLDFGRPMQLQLSTENLNDLAGECVEFSLSIAQDKDVKIETDFDPELPFTSLDKQRIKQVIMNLLVNAIQASFPKETVRIRTTRIGNEIELDISDCGCGIKEEDHKNIFEPFFTTKEQGTGLGLAIVKKIVKAHDGRIFLFSNPEGGVTFSVRLPVEKEK